jgi:uncharacterized membrane protein YgdD (TMEM256/DUF423 family)
MTKTERQFIVIGCILGGLSVALGAFGAHGLRDIVAPNLLDNYETGVRYQFFHAFALIAAGLVYPKLSQSKFAKYAGWLFLIGTIIFSGSLYGIALTGMRWLGAITPIGGVAYVVGWACLAYAVWQSK